MQTSPLTCSTEELYGVVSSRNRSHLLLSLSNPLITEDHIVALLRNPILTPEIIHAISERFDWASSYKIQFGIVNCVKTPHTLAMRLLGVLFWQDLVKITDNIRLNARLRRAAENRLHEKIVDLTLGERISLARTAPRAIISMLKGDREPRVFEALLRNPKLMEDDLIQVINDELTPAPILKVIGYDRQWTNRYAVKLALVRNFNTPMPLALGFLSKLRKQDLKLITSSPHAPELVRRAADRILAGDY